MSKERNEKYRELKSSFIRDGLPEWLAIQKAFHKAYVKQEIKKMKTKEQKLRKELSEISAQIELLEEKGKQIETKIARERE